MEKEEFIAKLQMVYVGDKNAFNELVSVYSELQQKNIELNNINDKLSMALNSAEQKIDKAIEKLYCWGEVLNPDFQNEMLKILKDEEVK